MRTRMLKASCSACGYTVRLTRKWARIALPACPDPDCARHGRPMGSPELNTAQAAEREAERAEMEAWEEKALRPAFRMLRDTDVRIRKRRPCSHCGVECQIGEPMQHRVYVVDGDMHSEYVCTACSMDRTPAKAARHAQGTAAALAG